MSITPPDDTGGPLPDDAPPPPEDHAGELAYKSPCRYCKAEVFVAKCDDGHWRTFDLPDYPAHLEGIWVWHKRHGMQEYARFGRPPLHEGESVVPGKRLHYCSEYGAAKLRLNIRAR